MISEKNDKDYTIFERMVMQFLKEEEFRILKKASVLLNFGKGETILKQGNRPTHIAFLQSGIAKFSFNSDTNDRTIILTLVSAPKILGGANLFYKDNNLFSIVAVEKSEVILIESDVLMELMKNNGVFSLALFQLVSDMFKRAILNFISVANKQKEGRIADVILYLSGEIYFNTTFNLSLTRKELAEFACCSVENVIMTLSRWQHEKIIVITGKQIEITDMKKLQQISKIG
ncbi:MAG: Crp/Fnr family transcriptional regulator [Bacteroidales bacterium]|jgi:CRP/FNR family transcriptional regulator|nr:Crp/Fnr family transcriptional regulator [Bacteroidales bacterium]